MSPFWRDPTSFPLLPCPFCGGKPRYNNEGNDLYAEWIECSKCTARVYGRRYADGESDPYEAWNKRHPERDLK